MIAIAAIVIVAQLPYLLDLFDPNPLGTRSALGSGVTPGLLGGSPTIDPNVGYTAQALGHRAMLDLVTGHLPWWNPYEGTGAPLAGEMQSAALFPPTLLLLLSNGQLYEHILLEIVAGIATYLLLRRVALSRWACLAGGVAFALDGTFAWFAHATVNPVAFLPLLLLGIERAYATAAAGRAGGWSLIAVAGALSFYAGFPEVAYIDASLAAVWFAWRLGCLERSRRRALAAKATAGAIVATLVAAPLMIAGIDYLGHADLGLHATGLLGHGRFPAQALPQLLMPYVYGPIFDYTDPRLVLNGLWGTVGGYVTILLAMLAVLGLCARGRRGLRIVLGVWIVLAFARMYGQIPLLGAVLGWLPGMSHLAFFRYATPTLELAAIVLAAIGVDDMIRALARRRVLAGTAGALIVVVAAAIGAHSLGSQLGPKYTGRPYLAAAVGWALLTVIAVAAITLWPQRAPSAPGDHRAANARQARLRGAALALLVIVDTVAMFATPELSARRSMAIDPAPVAFLRRHLGGGRVFTLGPLQPNYGSYYGLALLNVNDVPIPSVFARYVRAHLDPYVDPTVLTGDTGARSPFVPPTEQELLQNLAGYRAAGVAYVLTPAGQSLPQSPATFSLAARTPTTRIYHLARAASVFSATAPGCSANPISATSAIVHCPTGTRVIYREADLPGWSATVGGLTTPIQHTGGLFSAVEVPAGTHTLSFSYSPPHILWGWLAFAAGWVWLLGVRVHPRRVATVDGDQKSVAGVPGTSRRAAR